MTKFDHHHVGTRHGASWGHAVVALCGSGATLFFYQLNRQSKTLSSSLSSSSLKLSLTSSSLSSSLLKLSLSSFFRYIKNRNIKLMTLPLVHYPAKPSSAPPWPYWVHIDQPTHHHPHRLDWIMFITITACNGTSTGVSFVDLLHILAGAAKYVI